MCERTKLPTDAIVQLLSDPYIGDEYGCPRCQGEYNCMVQPPQIGHKDDCTVINARKQLAALQSAAQGMTLGLAEARKVLPSGKGDGQWTRQRIETAEASNWYSRTYGQFTLYDYGKISSGWLTTVDDVIAARCLELAMQGDSAEARALQEEYKG